MQEYPSKLAVRVRSQNQWDEVCKIEGERAEYVRSGRIIEGVRDTLLIGNELGHHMSHSAESWFQQEEYIVISFEAYLELHKPVIEKPKMPDHNFGIVF
jgi:hypothetical protein